MYKVDKWSCPKMGKMTVCLVKKEAPHVRSLREKSDYVAVYSFYGRVRRFTPVLQILLRQAVY